MKPWNHHLPLQTLPEPQGARKVIFICSLLQTSIFCNDIPYRCVLCLFIPLGKCTYLPCLVSHCGSLPRPLHCVIVDTGAGRAISVQGN